MRNILALLRRELNAYFASVLGYVVIMFFLVVMGVTFAVVVNYLATGPKQVTAMKIMFSMFWLPSLVVIPMITMRLLAEEKRAGTLEMLMTAPVTDFQVVLAKYLGAVVLYALMWGLTGLYVVVLRYFAGASSALDLGPIASGYIGVLVDLLADEESGRRRLDVLCARFHLIDRDELVGVFVSGRAGQQAGAGAVRV